VSDAYAIVVGRFYADLAERLVDGARRAFSEHRERSVDVFDVAGAFELPLGAGTALPVLVLVHQVEGRDVLAADSLEGSFPVERGALREPYEAHLAKPAAPSSASSALMRAGFAGAVRATDEPVMAAKACVADHVFAPSRSGTMPAPDVPVFCVEAVPSPSAVREPDASVNTGATVNVCASAQV